MQEVEEETDSTKLSYDFHTWVVDTHTHIHTETHTNDKSFKDPMRLFTNLGKKS